MTQWYVVGKEPAEGDHYVNVFGPFVNETDARAYAIDLAEDNGWESVVAVQMDHIDAEHLATDNVLWPYETEEEEQDNDQSGEEN